MKAADNLRTNIRRVCEIEGISQRDLAERCGLHAVTVNRILKGHNEPTLSACEQIANGLGIRLEELIADPVEFLARSA